MQELAQKSGSAVLHNALKTSTICRDTGNCLFFLDLNTIFFIYYRAGRPEDIEPLALHPVHLQPRAAGVRHCARRRCLRSGALWGALRRSPAQCSCAPGQVDLHACCANLSSFNQGCGSVSALI